MRPETAQALRDAYRRPRPLTAAPTKPRPQQRKPRAGDLKPGGDFLHHDQRLTITAIDVIGYGHRRGAPYRRLRIRGHLRGEPVTVYYASDEPIRR